MMRVLHVAPHFGGGVGQVLGNIAKYASFNNEFVFLDCLGEESRKNIEKYSLVVYPIEEIENRVKQSDIVQIEWWNHPLLAKFFGDFSLPPCRLLIYSHISGFHYPNILTKDVVNYCDRFVASTNYTLKRHPVLQNLISSGASGRISSIHSCAGLSRVEDVRKMPHLEFNVGYIGALDFSKLHPDFVKMSAAINVSNVNFPICGQGNDHDVICEQIKLTECAERFHLKGYVQDIAAVFSTMDILGYPLNAYHYGTGEQVLIESLGAGVPAVVMNNGCEKEIIRHGYSGMIVNTPEEYARCIEYLAMHPELIYKMGQNAREYARQKFSIHSIIMEFKNIYESMMKEPRRGHEPLTQKFANITGNTVYFLASLGEQACHYIESATSKELLRLLEADRKIAQENVSYTSSAKGTIFQYRRYFASEPLFTFWCGLIMSEKGEPENALMYFLEAKKLGFHHWRVNWYIWCELHKLKEDGSLLDFSDDVIEMAERATEQLASFYGSKFTNELLRGVKAKWTLKAGIRTLSTNSAKTKKLKF